MDEATRILIVEDVPADAELAQREIDKELKSRAYRVVETEEEFLDALVTFDPDVIVSDYSLPTFDGMTALSHALERTPVTPFIILTGSQNEDIAVACIKAGAADYVLKESIRRLGSSVVSALEVRRVRREKERAEASMRENEQRYRELVEDIEDIVYSVDDRGNILFVNGAAERFFGYKREKNIGRSFVDFLVPTSLETAANIFKRQLAGEEVGTFELDFYDKNGNARTLETREKLIWKEGRVVEVHGIGRDVTQRKRAVEALRALSIRHMAILGAVTDIIMEVDANRVYTWANQAGFEFFGLDVIGKEAAFYFEGEQDTYEAVRPLFEGDEATFYVESWQRRRDGERRLLGWWCRVLKDENATVTGALSSARDITERKRAEAALRESEERYRNLLELAPVGIAVQSEGKIVFTNSAGARIIGASSTEEVIGRELSKIIHPDWLKEAQERISRMMAGERGLYPAENVYLRMDGAPVPVEVLAAPITYQGKPAVQVIVTDISKRKEAERAIRESEERYRDLVENIADIVYVTDEQGKLAYLNAAAEQFIGQPGENILGRSFSDFLTPESLETCAEIFKRQLSGKDVGPFELDIYDSHGGVRTIETREKLVWNGDRIAEFQGIGRDITERKAAERAIRESEERYRELVENIDDIMYVTDGAGKIIFLNKALERVSGFTRDELLRKNYMDLLTPDSLKKVIELFKKQKKGLDVGLFELSIVDRDGKVKVIEAREQMVREGNRIVQMRGLGRDITERKRAEERIAHLNRVLESIRNVDQLIVRVEDQGTLLTGACEILCEVSGYYFVWIGLVEEGHKRVIPAAYWGFEDGYLKDITVTWDDAPTARGPMGTAIRTSRACVFNDIAANPDFLPWRDEAAKRGYRSLMAVPIMIGKRIYGALGVYSDRPDIFDNEEAALLVEVAEDIAFALSAIEAETERRRSEEALRESEEKFRDFFETSRDIVFITSQDGAIRDINGAFEEILGYTRQETLSKNVVFFYKDPKDRDRFRAATDSLGFVRDFEVALRRKNGTYADCLITAAIRKDQNGEIVGYQGTIRDISEKKQMERQLIQAEKLSSLGGILSGVAHEMNNPLTSIIGISQMIMRGPVPQEIKDKLEVIHHESMRTAKIIQGLLAFAREHKPERKMISVNKIVEESYRLREYEFRVDNIAMKLELGKGIPLTAADPYQLQQVFINLINNSHDALSNGGGSVLVIRSFQRKDAIVIEFEDDGPGIPEQDMGFIFDPFFTTKDVGKGTGLGLSIVYGIINEHGGKIDARSSPGKGATFTIQLPVIKNIVEKTTALKAPAGRPKGEKTVLVVEDEEALRVMIGEVLEQDGYRVQQCEGGQQAIETMKVKRFDAIITDLKMPGIGGKELYTFVQKYYPVLAPRVLFITGDVLSKDTQAFLKITGNIYLEKPFEIEVLLARLEEVLAR